MFLEVDATKQKLFVHQDDKLIQHFQVSTARNGLGEQMGSECTPRGWHRIRAKIGAGQPKNAVFIGRRPTGEVYSSQLANNQPDRDWILSRILWLNGLEPGKNRYGLVDSGWRYIYIHGCPDELMRGVPESHGCIRMLNADVIQLFDIIEPGCKVNIHA